MSAAEPARKPWSLEAARSWSERQPWLVGCNFTPSSASNQLEMWQAETFDPETIDRELGWAAELGFNVMRVYLHDLLWQHDRAGLVERIDRYLEISTGKGIATLLVLFDDCWNPSPRLGPQAEPTPALHNSRWVESPGLDALTRYEDDDALRVRLEAYVTGLIGAFADDARVLLWDLYNEPGGHPSPVAEPVGAACLPLLRDAFVWARSAAPSQPLTSGVWRNPFKPPPEVIEALQIAQSDILSFHHYGSLSDLEALVEDLRAKSARPVLCTEYLARNLHSRFETHLPYFRDQGIGAINWGLVSGRTQTIYPWWSWFEGYECPDPEPTPWFHDILRQDGSPYDADEVAFLRGILPGAQASKATSRATGCLVHQRRPPRT